MNNKERAAMQAAWVWMDWYASNNGTLEPVDLNETIAALREALAEPKKPEDCANGCPPLQVCDYCQKAEQAEQEPVAWFVQYKNRHEFVFGSKPEFIVDGVVEPLYTHLVRTKDLTDEELAGACGWKLGDPMYEWVVDIGRWAIAADREKNK